MKQLFIFFIIIILTSCFGKKQKEIKAKDDLDSVYGLSIDEVIEYTNYYEKDTLLAKVEVLHYKEAISKEKEIWYFKYGENNQLISEEHFLYKGGSDSLELVFREDVNDNGTTLKTIELNENDTVKFDQYQYDDSGNLINHKSKFKFNRIYRDSELFDYEYDDENRVVRMKRHDIIITKTNATNEISNIQYKYEASGDTIIKYRSLNDNLTSVEKTISSKTDPEVTEVYTYTLPDYKLEIYEKKNMIDKDNYIEIKGIAGNSVDSTFIQDKKRLNISNIIKNCILCIYMSMIKWGISVKKLNIQR